MLIGVGLNACELNEKITRCGRNQLRLLLGCLLQYGCSPICVPETAVCLSVCWGECVCGGGGGGVLDAKL